MENEFEIAVSREPGKTPPPQNQFSEFLTTKGLSDKLGKSTKCVEKRNPSKRLPGAVKIAGEWAFDRKMVEKRLPPFNTHGQFLLDPAQTSNGIQILYSRKYPTGTPAK